jgi:alpha-galactosidase
MISFNDNVFRLQTDNTDYLFRITKFGHLEHVYYGAKLSTDNEQLTSKDIEALAPKRTAQAGGSVVLYDREDSLYSLDTVCLEWSGIGKGDYRFSPAEIKMPDGCFSTDFIYDSYSIKEGFIPMKELPSAKGKDNECTSLEICLLEKVSNIKLNLIYTV